MKALESIIIKTLVVHKLHGKSKRALNHRCQVYPLNNKWKRASLWAGREKQGHWNPSTRTWRRQCNADGPDQIEIWYEAGAEDWLNAVVGSKDEANAKAKLWNLPTVIRGNLGGPHKKVVERVVDHQNQMHHPDTERVHVISNLKRKCWYSKATRRYQMRVERVNQSDTLVHLSNDWTSSSSFVTFMGP